MKEIRVKYMNKDYPRLAKLQQGDWIDLRVDSIKEDRIMAYLEGRVDFNSLKEEIVRESEEEC